MARPLSEEKRKAILASAAALVAAQGTGAPTAKIAAAAGVAEGTLFTYFANKDELLNQLFLDIEADLAKTMLDSYPADAAPRARVKYMWDRFLDWGAANPTRRKALRQLKVSDRVSKESKKRGEALFRDMKAKLEETLAGHVDPDRASFYIGVVLDGLFESTLEAIAASPKDHERFKDAGFDVFWKGIAR
jgi:AcrR family transcriptional regulator